MYGLPKNPFIESLELSVRASNVLRAWGRVKTLDEFLGLDRETVMALPNAGVRTWKEIEQMQKYLGSLPHTAFAPAPLMARDMTLRDAAALAALQGLLADESLAWDEHGFAKAAWRFADAFMAAREGKTDD
jgi:hypothetical protein